MIIKAKDLAERNLRAAGGIHRRYPEGEIKPTLDHFHYNVATVETPISSGPHPFVEFWFIVKGEAVVTIGEETAKVSEGDLMVTPPGQKQALNALSDDVAFLCFAKH